MRHPLKCAILVATLVSACTTIGDPPAPLEGEGQNAVGTSGDGAGGTTGGAGVTGSESGTGGTGGRSSESGTGGTSSESGSGGTSGSPAMPEAGGGGMSTTPMELPCTSEGARRCGLTASSREVCKGGVWTSFESCPSGTVCTTSPTGEEGACLSVAEACRGSADEAVCDSQGTLIQCGADAVAMGMSKCMSARHCQLGMATKTCATCVPGGEDGFQCEGAKLLKCKADGTGFEPAETCPTEALCNVTAGACTMEACSKDQVRCQGSVLQKCNADQTRFEMVELCEANLCDAQSGVCDACVPGANECQNASTALRCSEDGSKLNTVACPRETPYCVGAGKCVQCQSNTDCKFVCSNGACAGECKPGDVQCDGLVPETCDDKGAWKPKAACPYLCSDATCTGQCKPGGTRCQGAIPQTCDSQGRWVDGRVTANVCNAKCTPGDGKQHCNGTQPLHCDGAGSLIPGRIVAGTCQAECTPGDGKQHCSGTTPQTCTSSGTLVPGKVVADTCDADCTPGIPIPCDGTTKVECTSSGTFRRTPNAVPDCADCKPMAKQCDRPRKMSQVCNINGEWEDTGITKECGAECTPSASGCGIGPNKADYCWGNCKLVDDGRGVGPLICKQDGTAMILNYCGVEACTGTEEGLFKRATCTSNGAEASCGHDTSCVPIEF